MDFNTNEIIVKIYSNFKTDCKPFTKFFNSGELWDLCIKTVEDTELLNNMIFCNDIMEIPPVQVFLKSNPQIEEIKKGFDKKAVSAFWEYVFMNTLDYKLKQENNKIKLKGIKTATRYYNEVHDTKVITLVEDAQ